MADRPITLELLQAAVSGDAAAIRTVTRLQPAGGPGDKVFPPTYATDRSAATKYALETRRIDGEERLTVLLDSVASQANRMEEALLAAWEEGRLDFPVISVDFTAEEGLADIGRITTLQAPHRIADALLRDSIAKDETRFRDTPIGAAYTDATARTANAIFEACPTALIFGVWDSTGPRGGLGNKIQRALVSEIVGVGVLSGVKTESRIDPAGIQANVEVYHRAADRDDWTINIDEALRDNQGRPVPFSRKGTDAKRKGKASAINHSNVPPSIDATAGGVTFDYAVQTTVLSLPALRRLRFPAANGADPSARLARERAARTALAALALAAVAELRERGYDLRSRSLLVPESGEPLTLEIVPAAGGEPARYALTVESAAELVRAAAADAATHGLTWEREPLVLRPAPKLAELIRESRRRAAAGDVAEAEAG